MQADEPGSPEVFPFGKRYAILGKRLRASMPPPRGTR